MSKSIPTSARPRPRAEAQPTRWSLTATPARAAIRPTKLAEEVPQTAAVARTPALDPINGRKGQDSRDPAQGKVRDRLSRDRVEALLRDREEPTRDLDNKDREEPTKDLDNRDPEDLTKDVDSREQGDKDQDNVPVKDQVKEPFRREQVDERQALALDKGQAPALDKGHERRVSRRRDELGRDNKVQDELGRDKDRHRVQGGQAKVSETGGRGATTAMEQARPVVGRTSNDPPIADAHADLEDAAEFFRRGDDGDYPESLSPHDIAVPESESGAGERDVLDPAALAQRAARRARFTLWVSRGTGALALATALAFAARARHSAFHDSVVDERTPIAGRSTEPTTAVTDAHRTPSPTQSSVSSVVPRERSAIAPSVGNTLSTAATTSRSVSSARKPMVVRRTALDERASTRAQPKKVLNASLTVESKPPTARFSD